MKKNVQLMNLFCELCIVIKVAQYYDAYKANGRFAKAYSLFWQLQCFSITVSKPYPKSYPTLVGNPDLQYPMILI